MSKVYDWVLIIGLIYMFLGTDFTNGLLAQLAFGTRTDPDKGWIQKYLYSVHAKNDPMMRATPEPLYGRKDKLPPFLTNMGYTNLLLASSFEILLLIGLFDDAVSDKKGDIPKWLQFVSAAFIFRGITEILYGMQLGYNNAAPMNGNDYAFYWLVAIPQIYIPFLIADRFYDGTYEYTFNPARFAFFIIVPTILIIWGIVACS